MSNPGAGGGKREFPVGNVVDPAVPLLNLSAVRTRMDSLQKFLSETVSSNTLIGKEQMAMVSSEISSAIHQIILNGAALLSASTPTSAPSPPHFSVAPKPEEEQEEEEEEEEREGEATPAAEEEVVEIDAVELLAEHVHLCEVCGKGFKRDANLRMHMRAHGDRFKTTQALSKPPASVGGGVGLAAAARRFSCPYEGCNRNRRHKKFRALKSVVCVRNHFKRSHCPKMYACERCNRKSFAVVADLRSHLRHCGGEARWRCSCGTSFTRKDKLFGHVALFEGHMPALEEDEAGKGKGKGKGKEKEKEKEEDGMDGFFDGLLDGFGPTDGDELGTLQDVLGSPGHGGGFYGGFL